MAAWILTLAGAALLGCGDGTPSLDRGTVTSLPDGTAQGSLLSGDYRAEVYTKDCSGLCAAEQFNISVCDIGRIVMETIHATQNDGHIEFEGGSDLIVTRFSGGIDGDGTFDAGGFNTYLGGAFEASGRVQGSIDNHGHFQATAYLNISGSSQGTSIDCTGVYDVKGDRL